MTIKKALELLNDMEFAEKYQGVDEYTEMLIMCKEALEKQMPRVPEVHWNENYSGDMIPYPFCPSCNSDEHLYEEDNFCGNCGQQIDWKKYHETPLDWWEENVFT